jgi:hypothetical protein
MGLDTLATMRTSVQFILDDRADLNPTEIDRWINWTYLQISNPGVFRHRGLQEDFTVTLVLNQISYDISAAAAAFQVAGIYDVVYIDGTSKADNTLTRRKLRASQDVRTMEVRPFATGEPHRYALHGEIGGAGLDRGLIIDSQPDATVAGNLLLVRCWRYPDVLTGAGDLTVLSPAWDEVIIVGAAWRGWRDMNQPDRANEMKQQFSEMTQALRGQINVEAEDWESQFELDMQPYQPDARG